ncbi:unnamed protein product [Caenorhabditis brenneri]
MCRVLNWEHEIKRGLQVVAQYCPHEWAQQRQVTYSSLSLPSITSSFSASHRYKNQISL